MEQYIPKSALVAEIERHISAIDNCPKFTDTQIVVLEGNKVVLLKLLSFLDTLEVKEVDLEKEIQDIFQKYKNGYNGLIICNKTDFSLIAKHFFELGMSVSNKAQKGE